MGEWFPKQTLGSLPAEAARKHGDREALWFDGNRTGFSHLAAEVDRAAQGLLALGIRPGEKVALWLNNRPEWMHLMFAVFRIGAVLVPVNTRLRPSELAYLLKQSNSATLIAADRSGPVDYLAMIHELLPGLKEADPRALALAEFPDLRRVVLLAESPSAGTCHWPALLTEGGGISPEALRSRAEGVHPDDTALIMYTSGTTGFPKGVMHGHAMVRNVTDRINRMAITHEDVILMYLPLFHIFGFEGPMVSILSGARQVLTVTFDPEQALDLIERERVTLLYGFDVHLQDLLAAQEARPRDVSSLRTGMMPAGMHNTTAIARKTQQAFCPTLSCYGMSEFGVGVGLSFLTSTEEQRCEASGYPAPGYEVRIVDPETGQDQPVGVPGEMWVRGYMMMQGYYEKPEETANALDADGWLHSGDLGLIRPDGHLRFIGRYKDMLKVGGENVDPMEVEAFLLKHPGVNQAAVVGYPDQRLSEVAVAFVQPAGGASLDPAEVIAHCKGKMAGFKVPRHVILVEEFPMTASGKVQKAKLRELALQQIRGR